MSKERVDSAGERLGEAGQAQAHVVGQARFPLTGKQSPIVLHTELTGSTQDDLADLWCEGSVPAGAVMIADNMTAARGRVGRPWFTRAGKSLLVSVLLEFDESIADCLAWVTLAGAMAALESVRRHCVQEGAPDVAISWPNDVVALTPAGPRKLGGLLGEVCGRRDGKIACILGWGLNLSLEADELPTPTAASLLTSGLKTAGRDELIATYLEGLRARLDALVDAGDPQAAGLVDEANAVTETLRPGVVVGRPRLEPLVGDGIRVLPDASLEILTRNGLEAVTSGEVSLLGMQPRAEGEAR